MGRPLLTALLLAAALTAARHAASAQTPSADRSADAAAIRAHIESIFQAFVDKDTAKLVQTHGAEWRGFTPWSGRVIRGLDGYMTFATFPPGTPKNEGMIAYRISDFDVVFYGDTAVAAFVADLDVAYGGEKDTQKLTLVDVYHKEPKGWVQVASNTSLHPDEVLRMQSRRRTLSDEDRRSLLAAREVVWRAWFAGDVTALGALVPPELVTIEPGSGSFGTRDSTLAGSRGFAASGGKLTRIAFPRTDIQAYGSTVILYTTYEMDIQNGGQTRTDRGVATEVFVQQNGKWINTGWQLAPVGAAR
jgi:ketosteroid isomerase-like protein